MALHWFVKKYFKTIIMLYVEICNIYTCTYEYNIGFIVDSTLVYKLREISPQLIENET